MNLPRSGVNWTLLIVNLYIRENVVINNSDATGKLKILIIWSIFNPLNCTNAYITHPKTNGDPFENRKQEQNSSKINVDSMIETMCDPLIELHFVGICVENAK